MIYNPFCKCRLILFKIQIGINFLSLQLACQCFLDEYESYHNISDYYLTTAVGPFCLATLLMLQIKALSILAMLEDLCFFTFTLDLVFFRAAWI